MQCIVKLTHQSLIVTMKKICWPQTAIPRNTFIIHPICLQNVFHWLRRHHHHHCHTKGVPAIQFWSSSSMWSSTRFACKVTFICQVFLTIWIFGRMANHHRHHHYHLLVNDFWGALPSNTSEWPGCCCCCSFSFVDHDDEMIMIMIIIIVMPITFKRSSCSLSFLVSCFTMVCKTWH